MYQQSESFFKGNDGIKLFLQKWIAPNAKGTILITHGQAEHSDCYQRLVEGFDNQKWNFIAWDLRGHGRSDGLRGYANHFDDYILDFQMFTDACLQLPEVKNRPVVLLGHSMGGLVQTCSLLEKNYAEASAQVLSSPLFGVAVDVPAWKDTGATFLNLLLPKLTLGNEIKSDQLTSDLDIIREYEQDPYRHNRISSSVYVGFKREFPKILNRAEEITLPTLLHISDQDPVVSTESALKFFDRLGSPHKTLKIFKGGKHELYNDTMRAEVYQTVIQFLKPFIGEV
ncbi:MAG: lysophospholipase [Bdellovibrionaceae bacterium]|nr:lysophospholipase [Bdellovibrio sp.]